jgi:hypothetical protein
LEFQLENLEAPSEDPILQSQTTGVLIQWIDPPYSSYKTMKTLLHFFDQMSNFTSNLGLKFWWWALETIIYRFYSEGF